MQNLAVMVRGEGSWYIKDQKQDQCGQSRKNEVGKAQEEPSEAGGVQTP